MFFPIGATTNAAAIFFGAGFGMLLGNRLSSTLRTSIFQVLGLGIFLIGTQMALKTQDPSLMIGSLVLGAIIGEGCRIEARINGGGEKIKSLLRSDNSRFTDGFVTSSLIFCIGSMSIIGAVNEGLFGDLTVLFSKSLIDFFVAVAFGAVYGSGVMAAAIPLFLYEAALTFLASTMSFILTAPVQRELEAVGGILIIGIGLNLLELKTLRLSNFLPALVVIVLLCWAKALF